MRIAKGFDTSERSVVASLYWEAFGAKLGRILGPRTRAIAYISRALMPDHALCARDGEGTILGVAGFKTYSGALVYGRLRDLCAAYGVFGGIWRGVALALLDRDTDNDRFLIDGIFVAPKARGQGVGSRLIEALALEASERGYDDMRLDVVDGNTRAQELYARRGFAVVKHSRPGLFSRSIGLAPVTTMVRHLKVQTSRAGQS